MNDYKKVCGSCTLDTVSFAVFLVTSTVITLLCLIVRGGQIANFWEKSPSSSSSYYKRMT